MTAPRQTMLSPRQWRRLLAAGRKYRRPGTYAKTYEQTAMAMDMAVEFSWGWAHKRSATYAYYSSDREIARLRRLLARTDAALMEAGWTEAGIRFLRKTVP